MRTEATWEGRDYSGEGAPVSRGEGAAQIA